LAYLESGKSSSFNEFALKFLLKDSHYPRSTEQMLAFISPADELFYGGRAGGGKTDLLLGAASTSHNRSIIFRRIYPNLEGIVYRGNELFGSDCWNGSLKFWRFNNRIIQLGAMQYELDKQKYRGRPYDLYAFDEICEFLYSQYIFVTAWNRTTVKGQRVRIINTGNPPTDQEGAWVIDYWAPWLDKKHVAPALPGELRWFINIKGRSIEVPNADIIEEDGEKYEPTSRTYIPAKMISFLKDTNYERKLQALPEPLRSQLLYGDFGLWQQDDQWQIIPTEWVMIAMERWNRAKIPFTSEDGEEIKKIKMTGAGVDVARGGNDKTIIAPRYDNYIAELIKIPGRSTPDGQAVAGEVMKHVPKNTVINLDIVGVGSSPYDYLTDYGYDVNGIQSAAASKDTDATGMLHFANLRAAMWWNAREMLDPDSGNEICLPDDKILLRDLTTARWKVTARGIMVESKEDIKTRIGRSPDEGDAVVYVLYNKPKVGII